MNKIKLIVDSTVDLTKELYEQYDIDVIPLNVNFGEENYKDGINIDADGVYEKIAKYGRLPNTAAASPLDFENCFNKYINQGYDVIYIGLGSNLSTSFQNARIAAGDNLDKKIFIIDSKSLSTGSGLLALKISKYIKEGNKTAKEIIDLIEPLVDKVVAQFTVDTLDHIYKGGRCSGAAAIIGQILHIHPYLRMVDGKLIVYKKVRGPMKIAINEQLNDLRNSFPNIDEDNVMITNSGRLNGLEEYAFEEVKKIVGPEHIKVTKAGAVIATHCGPGSIGILYIKK